MLNCAISYFLSLIKIQKLLLISEAVVLAVVLAVDLVVALVTVLVVAVSSLGLQFGSQYPHWFF